MHATKACPIVFRGPLHPLILAFEHPLAGCQLVKGTIEPGEGAAAAAVRELHEEAGVTAVATIDLGLWTATRHGQIWSLHRCEVDAPLPDTWTHRTDDDGGRDFRFFWHPLYTPADDRWPALFREALDHIRRLQTRP